MFKTRTRRLLWLSCVSFRAFVLALEDLCIFSQSTMSSRAGLSSVFSFVYWLPALYLPGLLSSLCLCSFRGLVASSCQSPLTRCCSSELGNLAMLRDFVFMFGLGFWYVKHGDWRVRRTMLLALKLPIGISGDTSLARSACGNLRLWLRRCPVLVNI